MSGEACPHCARLRAERDEALETLRQARGAHAAATRQARAGAAAVASGVLTLAEALGVSRGAARVAVALLEADPAGETFARLGHAAGVAQGSLRVLVSRLRRAGVAVRNLHGFGYALDAASRARLNRLRGCA